MHKLISFIVVFVIFLTFIVCNLENKSDVSLLFVTFRDIPVYLSAFVSFAIGILFAFFIALYNKNKTKSGSGETGTSSLYRRLGKKTESGDSTQPDRIQGQDGPYGID